MSCSRAEGTEGATAAVRALPGSRTTASLSPHLLTIVEADTAVVALSKSVECSLCVRNVTSYLPLIPITSACFCCGHPLMCLISGFFLSKILAAMTASPNLSSLYWSAVLMPSFTPSPN